MNRTAIASELVRLAKELMAEHESGTRTLSGLVFGEKVKLVTFLRSSMEDARVPDSQLIFKGKKLVLNVDRMQPKLARLIPNAYASEMRASAWKSFITLAIGMGLL